MSETFITVTEKLYDRSDNSCAKEPNLTVPESIKKFGIHCIFQEHISCMHGCLLFVIYSNAHFITDGIISH